MVRRLGKFVFWDIDRCHLLEFLGEFVCLIDAHSSNNDTIISHDENGRTTLELPYLRLILDVGPLMKKKGNNAHIMELSSLYIGKWFEYLFDTLF